VFFEEGFWEVLILELSVHELYFRSLFLVSIVVFGVIISRVVARRRRAKEALRESEEHLKDAQRIAHVGSWDWNVETGDLKWSDESFRIYGFKPQEFIPTFEKITELAHPDDLEFVQEEVNAALQNKKNYNVDFRFIRPDEKTGWVHCEGRIVRDRKENPLQFFGTQIDITERKQAEEKLARSYNEIRSLNLELEERVKERTKELEGAVVAAEAANRAKSNFLASMSHELRTPLNAVIGFSEVLQDKYFGELNEKQAEYVKDILESGKHLLTLVNDILDITKVEAGKVELEPSEVNIKEFVEHSLVMIRERCVQHKIKCSLDVAQELEGLKITADERKLKQVMFSLLSNAAKFTPDGGEIRVAATRVAGSELRVPDLEQQPTRDFVEVSITDTGVGVTPEDQEKVFKEFYQVKGGIRDKTPGTGLGLTLAKQLVEMHGGWIWMESEGEGKGSRLSFVLPIR